MSVFGECPVKGMDVTVKSGPMVGETFKAEDWARNVMAKGPGWPSDVGNPSVIVFLVARPELVKAMDTSPVEFIRVGLTGIYGHVGWSGCIVMPDELGIEVDG